MAYDETLASRVRALMIEEPGFTEKKMFGGICFLLNGNMACGLVNDDLIVRVGLESWDAALELPETRVFDLTGKVMRGWVQVGPAGTADDAGLADWVARGVAFARSLPPK